MRPTATHMRLLGPIAVGLALLALLAAGCGSSSDDTATTPTDLPPPGSATTSNAPSGVRTDACVDDSLDPPEVVVIGGSCGLGRRTAAAWQGKASCHSPSGASRFACTVGKLRCLGVSTDRGIAVSCSRPNLSIAFVGKSD
jgi:hypothetical protein